MKGHVLYGFVEGEISFPPTYRYVKGSDQFSKKRVKKKIQAPSFCDRILYKSIPNAVANHIVYDSFRKIQTSDHKPVFSISHIQLIPKWPNNEDSVPLKLTIFELRGRGLSAKGRDNILLSGTPEPFITFLLSIKSNEFKIFKATTLPPREKVLGYSSEFTFDDADVEQFKPFEYVIKRLKYHYLFLEVRDRKLFGQNDVVAEGVLSLKEASESIGKAIPFDCKLTYQGLPAGEVVGKLSLSLHSHNEELSMSVPTNSDPLLILEDPEQTITISPPPNPASSPSSSSSQS